MWSPMMLYCCREGKRLRCTAVRWSVGVVMAACGRACARADGRVGVELSNSEFLRQGRRGAEGATIGGRGGGVGWMLTPLGTGATIAGLRGARLRCRIQKAVTATFLTTTKVYGLFSLKIARNSCGIEQGERGKFGGLSAGRPRVPTTGLGTVPEPQISIKRCPTKINS